MKLQNVCFYLFPCFRLDQIKFYLIVYLMISSTLSKFAQMTLHVIVDTRHVRLFCEMSLK